MTQSLNSWVILYTAIALEISGTYAMKLSDGFTRITPSICVIILYCCSLCSMSIAIRKIDLGVAYAVWSGVGIIATSVIGATVFDEVVTARKAFSISVILLGVASLNLAPAR